MTKEINQFVEPHAQAALVTDRRNGLSRRREPRWIPEGKTVTIFDDVTAAVRDESKGGICLKMPVETMIEMGQCVPVDDNGKRKNGRVCWTTVDNFGSHRFVGLAWLDSALER